MEIKIGDKIGEGNYRVCHAIEDTDLCVKRTKKYVTKKIFGKKLFYRSDIYNFFKFGVSDLNIIEYKAMKSLPEELSAYLPKDLELTGDKLIMERTKNYDGSYSKMMIGNGKVDNAVFWKHIDAMLAVFIKNKTFPTDIFYRGNNLMIKKISNDEWKPIMIDFKRVKKGIDLFHYFEFGRNKTFYRRLKRFQKDFRP